MYHQGSIHEARWKGDLVRSNKSTRRQDKTFPKWSRKEIALKLRPANKSFQSLRNMSKVGLANGMRLVIPAGLNLLELRK